MIQVLINLLSNAMKFCDREQGRVGIALDGAGRRTCGSTVRDNGPGISAEDQHAIFDKFRQGGDTLTDKPQGTRPRACTSAARSSSISAAGCGWKARRGAGRMFFTSRCRSPAAAGAAAGGSGGMTVHRASARSTPVSKKILIADDEPNIVAALEFLLQRSGYEVHVGAATATTALKLVERVPARTWCCST